MNRTSILSELMSSPDGQKTAPQLGLKNPYWSKEAGAYKVLGSIEAIEWFRTLD